MKYIRYCEARLGEGVLTQRCGARAKFVAESLCQDVARKLLCGTHANRWRKAGHEIKPLTDAVSGGSHG